MSARSIGAPPGPTLVELAAVPRRAGALGRRWRERHRERRWEAEAALVAPVVFPYLGLTPRSLGLAVVRPARPDRHRVNLVLPAYDSGSVFAGIRTALEVGVRLAAAESAALRVVVLRGGLGPGAAGRLRAMVRAEFGAWPEVVANRLEVVAVTRPGELDAGEGDLWVASYWTTAHALDVAVRAGTIDRSRVVYLIQDYEPAFLPGSTAGALAAATYHCGFRPLVNSRPVADHLSRYEGLEVPAGQVFAPQIDVDRLAEVAGRRRRGAVPSVLFYGRPGKPRNMYPLGTAALRVAARRIPPGSVLFRSAGQRHPDLTLTDETTLTSLGTLGWSSYFDALAGADVVLALQASPHPSHLPLDAAVSGAVAVTNDLGGTRSGLHPRIVAVRPEPDALASAVLIAVERSRSSPPAGFDPRVLERLGRPLPAAISALTDRSVAP